MRDAGRFALRTAESRERFREANADMIRARRRAYIGWVRGLPLHRWVAYLDQVPERDTGAVVGLLCLLYQDGDINITFTPDFRMIRRDADSWEELTGGINPGEVIGRKLKKSL